VLREEIEERINEDEKTGEVFFLWLFERKNVENLTKRISENLMKTITRNSENSHFYWKGR